MNFFIYHRPLHSKLKKEYLGDIIHISTEEKNYAPDGHEWKIRRCNRPQSVYTRLVKMLTHGGMESDMVYPLDGKRSVRDLVNYMNKWETK